jgi:hypothetical protein
MEFGNRNIGDVDRFLRLIVAVALLYAIANGMVQPPLSYVAGLLMLGLFFTVATGTCCLYTLLGCDTCQVGATPTAAKAAPARKARKTKKRGRKKS